jgi:hypothetical protein
MTMDSECFDDNDDSALLYFFLAGGTGIMLPLTYIAVTGPGVMGDNDAMGECELKKLIENLTIGYVVIGDAALRLRQSKLPIRLHIHIIVRG